LVDQVFPADLSQIIGGKRTLLFMAGGGVGKTSTLLKAQDARDRIEALSSDDLAVMYETGTVFRTPQKMQVYAYTSPDSPPVRGRSDRRHRQTYYGSCMIRYSPDTV